MFKARPAQIKAVGTDDGLGDGQFRALVSVFGNVDSYGDVVMPGAFSKTLATWAESGDPIPIYWSHQLDDPDMNIGYVLDAEETDDGLEVLGQLDLDPEGSPKARQVHRLMKGRRVSQFSFAYDVVDAKELDGRNELHELKLYEVGPTPIGANDQTELLAVKGSVGTASVSIDWEGLGLKVGRTISAKNEATLRDAASALEGAAKSIKNVLASIGGDSTDDGKAHPATPHPSEASGAAPANAEEPPSKGANAEEPNRHTSVATWETAIELTHLEGAVPWALT